MLHFAGQQEYDVREQVIQISHQPAPGFHAARQQQHSQQQNRRHCQQTRALPAVSPSNEVDCTFHDIWAGLRNPAIFPLLHFCHQCKDNMFWLTRDALHLVLVDEKLDERV
jgi:hypothetical protein